MGAHFAGGPFHLLGLAACDSVEHCFAPHLPPGEHAVSFTIDESRFIPEMDERNNSYLSRFTIPGAVRGPQQIIVAPGASTNLNPESK